MPMLSVPELSVVCRVGGKLQGIDCTPLPPYHASVIAFLGEASRRLLSNPEARRHPDIAAFAYWCRPANLRRLARKFVDGRTRIGRGLAFHIAPANVPINFAYSLAFGLLSGNANIVRVPELDHPQVAVVCDLLSQLLREPEYFRLAAMNRLVSYPRDDEITARLSRLCHARILWGGDKTIAHLRTMATLPRCVEIAFADRYSLCVLGADAVQSAREPELEKLVHDFYNDTYVLDQNACSSPHLVVWLGSLGAVEGAMSRFWDALARLVKRRYALPAIGAVEKFDRLCQVAIRLPEAVSVCRHGNWVHRVGLSSLPVDVDRYRGRYGLFFEYGTPNLTELLEVVEESYQTVTCYGIPATDIANLVVAGGIRGIDRIVPVGKALDIGVIWDGYDIIGTLSRIVATD